ncbi:hypothetical protein BU16DRAFT_525934, partial [Lophium mytilinum]
MGLRQPTPPLFLPRTTPQDPQRCHRRPSRVPQLIGLLLLQATPHFHGGHCHSRYLRHYSRSGHESSLVLVRRDVRVMNWFKIRYCEMSLDQLQARLDAYERQHKRYLENGDHELIIAGSARCMLLQDAIKRVDGQGKRKRFDMINWRRPPWGQGLDPDYLSKMAMPSEQPWANPADARTDRSKSRSSILGSSLSGSKCLETGAKTRPTLNVSHRCANAASGFKDIALSPKWSPIYRPPTPTESMRARDEISRANRLLGSSPFLGPRIPEEGAHSRSGTDDSNYFDTETRALMDVVPTFERSPIFALQDITPAALPTSTEIVPTLEKSLVHVHEDIDPEPTPESSRAQRGSDRDPFRYDSMSPSSSSALQDITPNGQRSSGAFDPKSKSRFFDADAQSPSPPGQWAPELTRRKLKRLHLVTKPSESSQGDYSMSRDRESPPAVDIILSPEDSVDDGDSDSAKEERQMSSMPQHAYEDRKGKDPSRADHERRSRRKPQFLPLAPVMRGGHTTSSKKRLASSAFSPGKRAKTVEKELQEDLVDPESEPPIILPAEEEKANGSLSSGWPSES